jgi:hypothetical protein
MLLSPDNILVMKVGFHGQEEWDEIVARKASEASRFGHCYWGYGGATCHPTTQVQPFGAARKVQFVGIPTESRFAALQEPANEISFDRVDWSPLSNGHQVFASRYALCLQNIRVVDCAIDLGCYRVALGSRAGSVVTDYLRFRCDKACATRDIATDADRRQVCITADLVPPFAVFLR